jgi:hypothetical protein
LCLHAHYPTSRLTVSTYLVYHLYSQYDAP